MRMSVIEMAKGYLIERNRRYGNNDDYSLNWYLRQLFDEHHKRVQGVIAGCIRDWHQRIGALDLASAEFQAEIKEKIEELLRGRYSMPDQ